MDTVELFSESKGRSNTVKFWKLVTYLVFSKGGYSSRASPPVFPEARIRMPIKHDGKMV